MYQSNTVVYQTESSNEGNSNYVANNYKANKKSCNGRCVPCTGECRSLILVKMNWGAKCIMETGENQVHLTWE